MCTFKNSIVRFLFSVIFSWSFLCAEQKTNLLKDLKGQSGPLQFLPFTSRSSSGNSPSVLGKAGFLHMQPLHFQVRLTLPLLRGWTGDWGLNQSITFLGDHTAHWSQWKQWALLGPLRELILLVPDLNHGDCGPLTDDSIFAATWSL